VSLRAKHVTEFRPPGVSRGRKCRQRSKIAAGCQSQIYRLAVIPDKRRGHCSISALEARSVIGAATRRRADSDLSMVIATWVGCPRRRRVPPRNIVTRFVKDIIPRFGSAFDLDRTVFSRVNALESHRASARCQPWSIMAAPCGLRVGRRLPLARIAATSHRSDLTMRPQDASTGACIVGQLSVERVMAHIALGRGIWGR
jgi:hypothetical protein